MKYFFKNAKASFALLLLLNFLLIYITQRYILTSRFYENNGDPLWALPGQNAGVYEKIQLWIYFFSAFYLLLKIGIIALIIHTALYLQDQDVSIGKVIRVSILAEYIFLIPAAVKIITFYYWFPNGTLLEWHKYYIFSAIMLFENAPVDWSYALQSINAFEVVYWFILAFGISKISALSFDRSLRTLMLSYVPALLIWIAVITFISLVMFPTTG